MGETHWASTLPASESERLKAVISSFEEQREFFQAEVTKNSWLNHICTTVSIIGAALAPVLVFVLQRTSMIDKLWIALPSAIAAISTGVNTSFGFKTEWSEMYYILSALLAEKDRLMTRSGPDYSLKVPLGEALDVFQDRVDKLVMMDATRTREAAARNRGRGNRRTPSLPSHP